MKRQRRRENGASTESGVCNIFCPSLTCAWNSPEQNDASRICKNSLTVSLHMSPLPSKDEVPTAGVAIGQQSNVQKVGSKPGSSLGPRGLCATRVHSSKLYPENLFLKISLLGSHHCHGQRVDWKCLFGGPHVCHHSRREMKPAL